RSSDLDENVNANVLPSPRDIADREHDNGNQQESHNLIHPDLRPPKQVAHQNAIADEDERRDHSRGRERQHSVGYRPVHPSKLSEQRWLALAPTSLRVLRLAHSAFTSSMSTSASSVTSRNLSRNAGCITSAKARSCS